MFGNKKDKIKKDKYSDLQCIVIPDVFYGGQDPYIYHSHIEKNNAVKGDVINDEKLKKQKKDLDFWINFFVISYRTNLLVLYK